MADKNAKYEGKLETIIGKGTKIDGTMKIEGSTRIDGVVMGKLESNDLVTIGPDGEVKAEVKAKSIIVGGRVEGNLEATEKIELQSKSELQGNLVSKSLLVEHGAIFHGTANMKGTSPNLTPKPMPPIQHGHK